MLKKMFVLVLMLFVTFNAKALVVSDSNISLSKGNKKSISLSTSTDKKIKQLEFSIIYTTYDLPASFTTNYNCTLNGGNYKMTFDTPVSGDIVLGNLNISASSNPKDKSGSISVINAKAVDVDGNTIELDSKVVYASIINDVKTNITEVPNNQNPSVGTQNPVTYTRLLKEIKSDIVKINIKDNVFEYFVKINEDISELDLVPVLNDEKFSVSVTTQRVSELENNKIIITVSNEEKEEKYEINVKVEDTEEIIEDEIKAYNYKWKWIVGIVFFGILLGLDVVLIMKKK